MDLRFRSRHHPLAVTRLHPESRPFLSSPLPPCARGPQQLAETGQSHHSPRGASGPATARTRSPKDSPHVQVPGAPGCPESLLPSAPSLSAQTRTEEDSNWPLGSHLGPAKRMRKGHSLTPPPKTLPQPESSRICNSSVPAPAPRDVPPPGGWSK